MTSEDNRACLLYYIKLCASFQIHRWIQTGVTVEKRSIWVKIGFFSRVTLKFDGWTWKKIGHLFCVASRFVHHSIAISEFKLSLQSGNAQFGSKSMDNFVQCDLEIWQMTLKNNLTTLLCYFKLWASFCSHWWIQTGVRVRKRLSWVLTCVTLTLTSDLDLLHETHFTLVIGNNSWKFHDDTMGEHSEKCVTDGQN